MATTTARFNDPERANLVVEDLMSESFEPRRFTLRSSDAMARYMVMPRLFVGARWGMLMGLVALPTLLALTWIIGAPMGSLGTEPAWMDAMMLVAAGGIGGLIIGTMAGLGSWRVVPTHEPDADEPVELAYEGPLPRAERVAQVMKEHGAVGVAMRKAA